MRVNRARLGLVVLMLPTLLVAMDMTALLLALPRLSAGLGATNIQQPWISDSFGFMVAGLVITMGTLGDRIGRRRLLMTCWASPARPWRRPQQPLELGTKAPGRATTITVSGTPVSQV